MSSFALQQAVYAMLAANTDLQALIGNPPRLFDYVPRDSAFPYVVLGDETESDWSTATEGGTEHLFTVHAWSRNAGHREAKQIAEIIRAALHDVPLTLADATLIDLRHLATDFTRESDGQTFRASLRLRAVTEP